MNSNSCFQVLLCLFAFFSYSLQDACKDIDCGQGKCVPDLLIPGLLFHCECHVGWKTIMVGPMSFSSCIIPNCTVDFSCGGKYPPTPPFPPINFTSPCNLVWCGDGDCAVNGTDHYCQCHERAANVLHNPKFICMQQCYLDGDCAHLDLFPPSPPPPPSSVASPSGGKNDASYSFTKLPAVLVAIFTGIFLSRT
ncbi:hypothetical protein L1987_47906 [Smallanthus sonchifolius]|uniref:Uncharacterized protein n=1 Tax=Smallanthus sonchifolius TaxID=185202 RepID=A0ACB9FPV7_9ASTR|nr:hypothetical protein L1987_47906 [Smallanthus sonchifolius]